MPHHPLAPQLNSGRVFPVLDLILDLAGGNIDDEFAELDRQSDRR
jgi:hypothetical protein